MKLTSVITGALVETATDEAAEKLIASGGFVKAEDKAAPTKKRASRKKPAETDTAEE